ncbi:MAG: HEAT repeat domain-containing protein [Asgard group archaeon]|nr:HEAT repeat domain-containing protein [Asgard group archaeon]
MNNISDLIKNLESKNDKIIRMRAAIALGEMGKKAIEAVPALIVSLKEDESAKVRENAAKALGQIGKDAHEAVPALVNSMMDDSSETVRQIAAESLGELGDRAVPALLSVLRTESDVGVIVKTIETLGKIGEWAKKNEPDLIEPIINDIVSAISRKDNEVIHNAAIESSLKMGEAVILPLLKIYKNGEKKNVITVIEIIFERLAQQLGLRSRAALIRNYDY